MRFIGRDMKTISYYLSVFTAIILLTGCAHPGRITGSDLTNLKLGMSEQEVINILGKPQSAAAHRSSSAFRYFEDHGSWVFLYHTLIFVDGKLTKFGPDVNKDGTPKRTYGSGPSYTPRGNDPVLILR